MPRKVLQLVTVVASLLLLAQPAAAQGFVAGYTDIGPTVGIGGIGSASVSLGARFERGIKVLPDLGNGVIGVMAGADYYTWSGAGYSWSYIPVGATANYHFRFEGNEKIDPFVGLGLGYRIISCNFDFGLADLCRNGALYVIGRAGGRYFLNEKMALYADVGAGAATLNLGLTLRLR
jgi:hypothetical protein